MTDAEAALLWIEFSAKMGGPDAVSACGPEYIIRKWREYVREHLL
jgi:hypothetical protein